MSDNTNHLDKFYEWWLFISIDGKNEWSQPDGWMHLPEPPLDGVVMRI